MAKSKVRIGDLYRCCVETASGTPGKEGKVISCKYAKNGKMIFHNGAWEQKQIKK